MYRALMNGRDINKVYNTETLEEAASYFDSYIVGLDLGFYPVAIDRWEDDCGNNVVLIRTIE